METVYQLLKDYCAQIKLEGEDDLQAQRVIEANQLIDSISMLARKEGILAIEEFAEGLDLEDETKAFFSSQLLLIVDGTEPEMVVEIGICDMISRGFSSYDGLIALMYFRAASMIQKSFNPRIIERCIASMFPTFIRKRLEEKKENEPASDELPDVDAMIDKLCADDAVVDKNNYTMLSQTAVALLSLSNPAMERLLRDLEFDNVVIMMKGLPGNVRREIFNNVSNNEKVMLAESIGLMGPLRLRDVEDACAKNMRALIKLVEQGEIVGFDPNVISIMLSVYDK